MEKINIIIGDELFYTDESISIVANLYIEQGGICFPGCEWTDIVSLVLGMWIHDLVSCRNSTNFNFVLYFVDGPFRIDVFKNDKMQLNFQCINSRYEEVIEHEFQCGYYEFINVLYKAFKTYAFILYKNNMSKGKFESEYNQTLASGKELKRILDDDWDTAKK